MQSDCVQEAPGGRLEATYGSTGLQLRCAPAAPEVWRSREGLMLWRSALQQRAFAPGYSRGFGLVDRDPSTVNGADGKQVPCIAMHFGHAQDASGRVLRGCVVM